MCAIKSIIVALFALIVLTACGQPGQQGQTKGQMIPDQNILEKIEKLKAERQTAIQSRDFQKVGAIGEQLHALAEDFYPRAHKIGKTALHLLGATIQTCEGKLDCRLYPYTVIFPGGKTDRIHFASGGPGRSSIDNLYLDFGAVLLATGYEDQVLAAQGSAVSKAFREELEKWYRNKEDIDSLFR